jgi:hypothetical protein
MMGCGRERFNGAAVKPRKDERPQARAASPSDPERRRLSLAAERALAEAQARRASARKTEAHQTGGACEMGGRDGPDPVRYGDWEIKGRAIDF